MAPGATQGYCTEVPVTYEANAHRACGPTVGTHSHMKYQHGWGLNRCNPDRFNQPVKTNPHACWLLKTLTPEDVCSREETTPSGPRRAPTERPVSLHNPYILIQNGWTLIRQVIASSDALTFALNLPRCPCVLTQHGWGLVSLYGPRCSRVRQSPCVLMPSSWIQTKQPSLVDLRVLTTPPMPFQNSMHDTQKAVSTFCIPCLLVPPTKRESSANWCS